MQSVTDVNLHVTCHFLFSFSYLSLFLSIKGSPFFFQDMLKQWLVAYNTLNNDFYVNFSCFAIVDLSVKLITCQFFVR